VKDHRGESGTLEKRYVKGKGELRATTIIRFEVLAWQGVVPVEEEKGVGKTRWRGAKMLGSRKTEGLKKGQQHPREKTKKAPTKRGGDETEKTMGLFHKQRAQGNKTKKKRGDYGMDVGDEPAD